MQTHDSLGRRFPNHITPPDKTLVIHRAREQMLQRLDWFVALPNHHLKAYLHNFGIIKEQNKVATLTDLASKDFGDNYIWRNPLQLPDNAGGWVPRSHSYVSELGAKGIAHLKKQKLYIGNKRTSGFFHELTCSITLAEIELTTMETDDITFKPRHMVTKIPNGYPVTIDRNGKEKYTELRDDGFFQLDYNGRKRAHFVELDLSNEQLKGNLNGKKTVERMLRQWSVFLRRPTKGGRSLFSEIFNLDMPAVVHFRFISEQRMKNAMDLLMSITDKKGDPNILFDFDTRFRRGQYQAPTVSHDFFHKEHLRAGRPPVRIDNV